MATLFGGCHVVLDLTTSVSFKKKQEIRKKIIDNDGIVSYIVTKKSTHVVCNDPAKADVSYKCKMAQKYGIPVVSVGFLYDCVEEGRLLSSDDYLVIGKTRSQKLGSGRIAATKYQILGKRKKSSFYPPGVKAWPLQEKHTPIFNSTKYQVAKYAVLQKYVKSAGRTFFCVLEVHVTEERDLLPRQIYRFRVSQHHGILKHIQEGKPEKMECYYVETSEEATKMYSFLYKQQTDRPNLMEISHDAPPRGIGTLNFQKMMMAFGLEKAELSEPVCQLVEGIWKEAYSDLSAVLTSPSSVKLEQIEKAEALLMKLRGNPEDKQSVLSEYYSTLPHNNQVAISTVNNAWLSSEQDLCQVMKDMLTVSEATGWSLRGSTVSKYRALRCQIEHRPPDHHVYKTVKALINKSLDGSTRLNIVNIFEVQRQMEEDHFTKDIFNQNLLFHASKPNNFVGILSRGLLMPKMVVDEYGGKRTDAGMLGAGIYFASAASTSVKYSQVSKSRGTRMMLVNKVALGKCMDLYKHDQTLDHAPHGYSSVHGVAGTSNKPSDFTEDEYVVYSPDQQKMCYLVEFTVGSEKPIPMEIVPVDDSEDISMDSTAGDKINLKDVKDVLDPMSKVKSGLIADGKDINPVELKSVNVCGKLMDLVAEVKVLQEYYNKSDEMLEGKYVFPLDEMAAVCGFEAYINDKHVVGEVKEKETAHKEYKKAISEGHGAYLMDQDEEAPDVFTVSVGNVPPKACVIIKITYVTELQVEGDLVSFRLPGNLAPWKESKQDNENLECCFAVAVDMPFDIRNIHSPTHKIEMVGFDDKDGIRKVRGTKPKGSKAMVTIEQGQSLGEGFQLLIELAEAHVPRMWVEQDEDNPNNQACMLTFYPEFEACEDNQAEVILMLDLSNSMTDKGLIEAKKVLFLILHHMPNSWTFNVVIFGTTFRELFPSSQPKTKSNVAAAEALIQSVDANMGNTDLYRPLHSFYLLKPDSALRNVFLVSDGHINHQDVTMDTVHRNSQHTRVFTFGVSNVMNRHLLGALARVGAGAFEGFDSKAKSKWEDKVKSQISKAGQPGLTSVAVAWQQEDGAPAPKQAPNQITALFSGSRMVVYGFVQNCTSAMLSAEVGDQEISALVTKSDRYVTKGKILHRLAAKAIIRDWEDGLLSSDGLNQQKMKMDLKDYVVKLSKQFCIVTQLTSFIAVEKREKDEKFTSSPDIDDLLELEQQELFTFFSSDSKLAIEDLWGILSDSEDDFPSRLSYECEEESSDGEMMEDKRRAKKRSKRLIEYDLCSGDTYDPSLLYETEYPEMLAYEISEAISHPCASVEELSDEDELYQELCELVGSSESIQERSEDKLRSEEKMLGSKLMGKAIECEQETMSEPMSMKFQSEISEPKSLDRMMARRSYIQPQTSSEEESEDEMGFGLFEDCDLLGPPRTMTNKHRELEKLEFLSADLETDSSVSQQLVEPEKYSVSNRKFKKSSISFETAEAAPPIQSFDIAFYDTAGHSPSVPSAVSGGPPSLKVLERLKSLAGRPSPTPLLADRSAEPPPTPSRSAGPHPLPAAVPGGPPPLPPRLQAKSAGLPLPNPVHLTRSAEPPPPPPLPVAVSGGPPPLPPHLQATSAGLPPSTPVLLTRSDRPPPRRSRSSGRPPAPSAPLAAVSGGYPPPPPVPPTRTAGLPPPTTAVLSGPPPPPPGLPSRSVGYLHAPAYFSAGPPPPPPLSAAVSEAAPPQQAQFYSESAGPTRRGRKNLRMYAQPCLYSSEPPPQSFFSDEKRSMVPPPPLSGFVSTSKAKPQQHHQEQQQQQQQQQLLQQQEQQQQQQSDFLQNVADVNGIFKDLSTMIHEQEEVIDTIEANVEQAYGTIEDAKSHLKKETVFQESESRGDRRARGGSGSHRACLAMKKKMMKKVKTSVVVPQAKEDTAVSWRKVQPPHTRWHGSIVEELGSEDWDEPDLTQSSSRGFQSKVMLSAEPPLELFRMSMSKERSKKSGCMGSSGSDMSLETTRGLHVDGNWIPDKGTPDEMLSFFGMEHHPESKPCDPMDIGSKMPTIAKTVKKNLTKKEFDLLKSLQNKDGGWTRNDVEKALSIDMTVCIEALNTAGLKSLGSKVAAEMESVLVTAFVLMWILKSLVPELFPLDTTTKNWSDTIVMNSVGPLDIFDWDRSILDRAICYCNQTEKSYPGVSSVLELGSNWFKVALNMLGF